MRVEKADAVKQEMSQLRRELKSEVVKSRHGKLHGCLWVFGLGLIVLILGGLWSGWTAARSGLVTVPGFSWTSTKTEPAREIIAGVSMEDTTMSQLAPQLQHGSSELTLVLPEAVLTRAARDLVRAAGTDASVADWSKVQVAVLEQVLEVWVPLKTHAPEGSSIRVQVTPRVKDGHFALELASVDIGSASIPGFVVRAFLQPTLNAFIGNLNDELSKIATVSSVTLENQSLRLIGSMNAGASLDAVRALP